MSYTNNFLSEMVDILDELDSNKIDEIIKEILKIRENNGRLFFLGVGGSAANASHAVNDFRKIANIECYTPIDNISELTARTNDDGWQSVFVEWLKTSKLNKNDAIFVLSVGGGNKEKNVSINLIKAIDYSKKVGAKVLSIVGKSDGYTYQNSDVCILIPSVNQKVITPQAESFQSVLLHLIVSHPILQQNEMKWESMITK